MEVSFNATLALLRVVSIVHIQALDFLLPARRRLGGIAAGGRVLRVSIATIVVGGPVGVAVVVTSVAAS